jgi:hypothetical protein
MYAGLFSVMSWVGIFVPWNATSHLGTKLSARMQNLKVRNRPRLVSALLINSCDRFEQFIESDAEMWKPANRHSTYVGRRVKTCHEIRTRDVTRFSILVFFERFRRRRFARASRLTPLWSAPRSSSWSSTPRISSATKGSVALYSTKVLDKKILLLHTGGDSNPRSFVNKCHALSLSLCYVLHNIYTV